MEQSNRSQSMRGGFCAIASGAQILAKRVLLATGVVDKVPLIEGIKQANLAARLRWCPICDGYEAIGREVAILSDAHRGPDHALFLRTYTARVTLFLDGGDDQLSNEARRAMQASGIRLVEESILKIQAAAGARLNVCLSKGEELQFDTLYPLVQRIAGPTGKRIGCPML